MGLKEQMFDGIMEDLLTILEINACFPDGIRAFSRRFSKAGDSGRKRFPGQTALNLAFGGNQNQNDQAKIESFIHYL